MKPSQHRTLEEKISILKDVCQEEGLRMTRQRLEILRSMHGVTDHPSVETVYRRVKKLVPNISLDTVYRTLSTFERHGLVLSVPGDEDQQRFDPNTHPHHHLVCMRCKCIEDFSWDSVGLDQLPPEVKAWGEPGDVQVVVRGICRHCLNQKDH